MRQGGNVITLDVTIRRFVQFWIRIYNLVIQCFWPVYEAFSFLLHTSLFVHEICHYKRDTVLTILFHLVIYNIVISYNHSRSHRLYTKSKIWIPHGLKLARFQPVCGAFSLLYDITIRQTPYRRLYAIFIFYR